LGTDADGIRTEQNFFGDACSDNQKGAVCRRDADELVKCLCIRDLGTTKCALGEADDWPSGQCQNCSDKGIDCCRA